MRKIGIFIVAVLAVWSCQKTTQKDLGKKIVFVCTHGASRSPLAAAYFNEMAKEAGLKAYAVHKAITPKAAFDEKTVEGLTQEGLSFEGAPAQITEQDINEAYTVVSFDCELPKETSSNEQWNGTPSPNEDYAHGSKTIKKKVSALIDKLVQKEIGKTLRAKGYQEIHFSKVKTGHLVLDAKINGVDCRLILDSGAGATVIDEKSYKKLNIVLVENSAKKGTGVGGHGKMTRSKGNSVTMGHFKLSDVMLHIMNLDYVNNAFEAEGVKRIDGIVGANIFSNNAIINYGNNTLYLKK